MKNDGPTHHQKASEENNKMLERLEEENPHVRRSGSFNKMVSLGTYDPEDLRKYHHTQSKLWFSQAWSGIFGVYALFIVKEAKLLKVPSSRTPYLIAFLIPALLVGLKMTVGNTNALTNLDDKYYPLYIRQLNSNAASSLK